MTPSDQYIDPHCEGKQVIVQLFEWRFVDIADECERFLGDKDFCGVQVSTNQDYRHKDCRINELPTKSVIQFFIDKY